MLQPGTGWMSHGQHKEQWGVNSDVLARRSKTLSNCISDAWEYGRTLSSGSFLKIIFNWRIIALQWCVLCPTMRWISHKCLYIPSLLSLPLTQSPSHPARSCQSPRLNSPCLYSGFPLPILHKLIDIFQCSSLSSSHPLLTHCVHKSNLYVSFWSCPANRFIGTTFLDSICVCSYRIFFSFWLTLFCIRDSRFFHLSSTGSNLLLFMAE